jgi:hypothetical protein
VTPPGRPGTAATLFVGGAVAFVAAVQIVRAIRPALLVDPDLSWMPARLLLWIGLISATSAAGALSASVFFVWTRSRFSPTELAGLPFSPKATFLLAAVALFAGFLLRFVWLETLPFPFLEDEVNLIVPSLGLTGHWRDFANSIRPMPYGVPDPHEMIGVLYLRLFRASLGFFGATILGVRFLSLAGGVLSLMTGTLLGRALLPAGGGAVTALVLAGLRWHLILSRFGWHSVLLVPLLDLATLLLIVARRRQRGGIGVLAGAILGVGTHFYLSAWIPFAALMGFCFWPKAVGDTPQRRAQRLVLFTAGFLAAVAPLFLFREGRVHGYFERTSRHSVLAEIRYTRSLLPPFSVAADAFLSPWLIPDPEAWHDLPGRTRLGWIIGIPVALAFAGALVRPREELSGLLLLHAGAALAAAVAGGQAGHPNGFRFGYLTTLTAVAAAAGALQFVRWTPTPGRRAAAIAIVGLLAASGAVGAGDALLRWPDIRATFDSFHGEDTLLGRAAARWQRYGIVQVTTGLGRSDVTIDTVRRYGLSAESARVGVGPPEADAFQSRSPKPRYFRFANPRALPSDEERIVERVRDGWGREWALVFGTVRPSS